jgi:periplasmic divalent cation tolerance protein
VSSAAEPSSFVIVLTTVGADADAADLARTLVDQRLAACVNIVSGVTSIYRWKDAVEEDAEQLLVIKTRADLVEALQARLRELHPYELPEFLVLPVKGGSEGYLTWLRDSVG